MSRASAREWLTSHPEQNYRSRLHVPDGYARGADDSSAIVSNFVLNFPDLVGRQCVLLSIRPDSYLAFYGNSYIRVEGSRKFSRSAERYMYTIDQLKVGQFLSV